MKPNILIKIAGLKGLTTYHYKVILYLLGKKEATQAEMTQELETSKQNINKVCKDLSSINIIEIKRKEGRNIFWVLNLNPIFKAKGQLTLDDIK